MSVRPNPSARGLAALALALLSGCAAIPDLGEKPALSSAEDYEGARTFTASQAAWPSDGWWRAYGDPQLDALIAEALSGAPSLAAASARLRQAEGQMMQARSSRFAKVSGELGFKASWQDLSADGLSFAIASAIPDDQTNASGRLRVSRTLDFFGKNRASIAAATSTVEAVRAEEAAARLELSAAVAETYAELSRLYAERAAAENAFRIRSESAALVSQRLDNGLENAGRLHQAQAGMSAAQADLAAVDGDIQLARNAMAALLGRGPDRGLDIAAPRSIAPVSDGLPANLALDLVGRRPDLAAARSYAEAAAERIHVARTGFYPNVNLSALAGIQTLGLDRLGGGELVFVDAGPAVSLPIFDGGNVEGGYRSARAQYDEAVALYDQSLVNALREVADAISARRSLEARLTATRAALASAEEAHRMVRVRYEGGLASYIDALSVEDQLVDLQRALANLEAGAFTLDIALIRALGGGYAAA